jgi:threonine dehydratase
MPIVEVAPMHGPSMAEVLSARARMAGAVRRTPLESSVWLSDAAGSDVRLKLECWQPTRSFKVRGAISAMTARAAAARERGVVTASAGNHGQAVALGARAVGARATIFVPTDAPVAKKQRIVGLGAALDERAATYDDAEVEARAFAARTGAVFVHAFSDADVVAGQATVGLEIAQDLPDVRTVIVPVGGGGLIAGAGAVLHALLPGVRLVGVQSVETRTMHESLCAGHVVDTPVTPTLADGLAGGIDESSFQRVRRLIDEVALVEEDAIADAMRRLFANDGVVAEGAAAVAAAAIVSAPVPYEGPIVAIVTGGNVDADRFSRILGGQSWRT